MQLELMFGYQPQRQESQIIYDARSLEALSASALYSESNNDVKRDGTMETIIPSFIGNDTVKVYIDPLTGKTDVGYQNGGESHRDYMNSGRIINVDRGSRS